MAAASWCRRSRCAVRRVVRPVPGVTGSGSGGRRHCSGASPPGTDSSGNATATATAAACTGVVVGHSPARLYPGHRPTGVLERAVLTLGSGLAALLDQKRGDMVAVFGETSGHFALQRLKHKMMASRGGRLILRDRPRITSKTIHFESLLGYPEDTLGRVYADFMTANRISPDSRLPVRYVNDPELAYVMRRYRETHDFLHVLLDQKTNLYGEIVVKWFEATQTELPMCALGAMGALFKLPAQQRRFLGRQVVPKVVRMALDSELILNFQFEHHLDDSLSSVKTALNLPQNTAEQLQGGAG